MIAKAIGVAALISIAPIQCAHSPDPNERREDTAGDALWSLSQKFEADHNEGAARDTLKYLVDNYPSNRHADAAREELEKLGDRGDAGNSG